MHGTCTEPPKTATCAPVEEITFRLSWRGSITAIELHTARSIGNFFLLLFCQSAKTGKLVIDQKIHSFPIAAVLGLGSLQEVGIPESECSWSPRLSG